MRTEQALAYLLCDETGSSQGNATAPCSDYGGVEVDLDVVLLSESRHNPESHNCMRELHFGCNFKFFFFLGVTLKIFMNFLKFPCVPPSNNVNFMLALKVNLEPLQKGLNA